MSSQATELEKTLEALGLEISTSLEKCQSLTQLEECYKIYIGKKGKLSAVLKHLSQLSLEDRQTIGRLSNEKRKHIEEIYTRMRQHLAKQELEKQLNQEFYDCLRPLEAVQKTRGRLHPITQMQHKVEDIFTSMGFEIMDGPEVESDEYNFSRLNFSKDHPARDMQDTIWTVDGNLMRTHTSAVQVRAMEVLKPPFRIIAPGRCFRYEETDASHENTFHQVEGMMVDREISLANLIYVMKIFLSSIFEQELKVRLRPGYFPFVEPGFELDMSCLLCQGQGCQTCKQSGWLELLPCGLVHPNVLTNGGIDANEWSGFAFGLGLDRLVMMRYGIEDIRHFLSGNLRFLEQF